MNRALTLFCLSLGSLLAAPEYKVGVASVVITPTEPIYLSGYARRTHASEGVELDLKAKALVIEDKGGGRVAIVSSDIIGYPRSLSDPLAARISKLYGLERSRLLLNASHTHTGPLVGDNLHIMFELTPRDQDAVGRYARKLADDIVSVVGTAIQNLAPARLSFGHTEAHFAVNRREPSPTGIKIGVNPSGPTDPDVPVLKVTSPDGKVRALLFGYACHNTTLTGEFYKISGDFAGFAQQQVEESLPGTTALFLELCGGDQNPNPRSSLELARQHGNELASAVVSASQKNFAPVRGPVRAAFQIVDLEFAYQTREAFESRVSDENPWHARHARAMLRTYDDGRPIRRYPYPVQAVRFGKDLTVVALGGEVVVDYCLRAKRTYGAEKLVVAGYSNDVMCYIPSERVLKEGGYEVEESMVYYGQPGRWANGLEDRIFDTLRQVMRRVGIR